MSDQPFLERVRDAAATVARTHRLWHEANQRLQKDEDEERNRRKREIEEDPPVPFEVYQADPEIYDREVKRRESRRNKGFIASILLKCMHPDYVAPPSREFVERRLRELHGSVDALFILLESSEAGRAQSDLAEIAKVAEYYSRFREDIRRSIGLVVELPGLMEGAVGEISVSPQADKSDPPSEEYVFELDGSVWEVRFPGDRGGRYPQKSSKGLAYIHDMLGWGKHKTSKDGSGMQVDADGTRGAAASDQDTESPEDGQGGLEATDATSIAEYKRSIEEAFRRAEAAQDPADKAAELEEAERLQDHLRRVSNWKGQPRKTDSLKVQEAKTVAKAIGRAIQSLRGDCPNLAAYLDQFRQAGEQVQFAPTKHHAWKL